MTKAMSDACMIVTAIAVAGWFFAIWFAAKWRHAHTVAGNLYRRSILLERFAPANDRAPTPRA